MKRKAYGRDAGLSLRMLLASSLLGLLYVLFAVVLFYVLNAGLVPMLLIVGGLAFFQYFTSDKLALQASGAKVVERRRGAGAARHDRAPVRDGRPARSRGSPSSTRDVPNAFATGRNPKHAAVAVTTGLWNRLEPRRSRACSPTSSRTSPTATCSS